MKLRIVLVVSAILLFYFSLHYYIVWHVNLFLHAAFGIDAPAATGFIVGLLALSYLISQLTRRLLPHWVVAGLKYIGAYWFGMLLYLILFLPLADLAAWLLHLALADSAFSIPLLGWIGVALLIIILIRGSWNAWNPVVRRHEISVPKRAGDLGTLRIAVASDLHLGTIVGNRHLQRLIDQIERINPDLVLLPGDVIDDDIEPFIRYNMSETMMKLQAPLGVYAILGNHEYYGGSIPQFLEEMRRIGIRVLLDETVKVADAFYIVGRKDRTAESERHGGRKSISELLLHADPKYPIIAMDHQPHQYDKAVESGVDLLLSGHTHRGQMAPNHWITRRLFELDWGYVRKLGMHAFVSSGFGTWGPPIRIGSRSEILQIDVSFL